MGLFSDIFKYRERRSVTPIENFTTEILKHLLKKYPQLIKSIFFKTLPDDIDFSTINIESQFCFPGYGILDLYIFSDHYNLAIIIENKIDASFQEKQIERYKKAIALYKYNKVITLVVHSYDYSDIGMPHENIFWSDFLRCANEYLEAENITDDLFVEFNSFAKENNMAIEKVGWALLDGLKEKQKLLNMIRSVFENLLNQKIIERGSRDSHSEDYNAFSYKYKDFYLNMHFFHSRGIMYIVAYDKDHKLTGLPRSSDWPDNAILSEYDFNVAHFFPLGISEQMQELNNCIMTAIEKLKPFSE